MKKFEHKTVQFATTPGIFNYKFDSTEFERVLNDHGQEGWELASCFTTNIGGGHTRYVYAVFKREIESCFSHF